MARRGENTHKRKDGRWESRYIMERTPEGKIQWGYIYGTAYAEVKRIPIQKKAEAGFYNLKRTDQTFEALAEVWLRSLRNAVKEFTYAHYSYTLHKYLLPVLSKVSVASFEESFSGTGHTFFIFQASFSQHMMYSMMNNKGGGGNIGCGPILTLIGLGLMVFSILNYIAEIAA